MSIENTIRNAVCEHLVSGAVAAGMISEVDPTAWVEAMCVRFPIESRPEEMGLTKLHNWLIAQGVNCGRNWAKVLRERWIADEIRAHFAPKPAPAPYFIEKLPASKTHRTRTVRWNPDTVQTDSPAAAGILTIDCDKKRDQYRLQEFSTGWAGRAFNLCKLADPKDGETEDYNTFVCSNGVNHSCDCAGRTYRPEQNCKHLESLIALLENRWI